MGSCFSAEAGGEAPSGAGSRKGSSKKGSMFGYETDFAKRYSVGKELGRGTFGVVHLCKETASGKQYAVKSILKSALTSEAEIEDVRREVNIMKTLHGKNKHVVGLHATFEDKDSVKMCLDVCAGGELFDRIIAKKSYSEHDAATIVRQMLEVVAVCHVNGIIHRDLKPENFLFASEAEDADLKVTDFGLSTFWKEGQRFTDVVGSAYYIAPEVLQRGYGLECDVWSVGVIMYILLCGRPPFFGRTESSVFNSIMKSREKLTQNFRREPWPKISKEAKQLILKMLTSDPKARITAAQALADPWVRIDGVAPNTPLDISVVSSMKEFTGYNKIKVLALRHVALAFDEEELRDLRAQFAMMDKDGSGTLTLEEMIEALQQLELGEGREPVPDEQIKEIVEALDYNNDGSVDYVEFITAAMHIGQKQRGDKEGWAKRVRTAFDNIDKDGNGFISLEEFAEELKHTGETPETIKALVAEHDEDGDGRISFQEFSNILRQRAKSRVQRDRTLRESRQKSGKK